MDTALFVFEMILAGIGVGLLGGGLGLGGGTLMVPAFVAFVPGMDFHTAKGTSLFLIIFVALLNAWLTNKGHRDIPWRLAAILAAGSIVGGYLGAWITTLLPEAAVQAIFLALILILGVRTFFLEAREVHDAQVRRRTTLSIAIGVLAGVVGGATGTGGGAVLIPLALMAGIVANERVVGLSMLVMIPTSIAGSIAHLQAAPVYPSDWTIGHVYLPLVPLVFIGVQIGSPLGAWLNTHLTLRRRRVAMGIMLFVISLQILSRMLS